MIRAFRHVAFVPFLLQPLVAQDGSAAQQPAPAANAAEAAAPEEPPAPTKVPVLRPSGAYADLAEAQADPLALLMGGGAPPKSFYDLRSAIEGLAKADSDVVLLDLSRPFGLNLPQLREVERSLAAVRAAGKQVVCYLEGGGTTAMQVAACCDRVLMVDMGGLEFASPALNVMHFKDALALLGVEAEMTRVGEFKGAVEPYVRSSMSDGLREHYLKMLASMNDDIVRRVAAGRKLDPAKVRELQAQRLFSAEQAKAAGLVDELVPYDGADTALKAALAPTLGTRAGGFELTEAVPKKKRRNRDLFQMLSEMFRSKRDDDDDSEDQELVVLHLAGAIQDGHGAQPGSMVSGPSVDAIEKLIENDHVKGVVVRVDSPGGSATASEAIRRALVRLAEKKPVVYSMGRLAASGGYWITCIGRPILAEAGTITGSIGVFSLRMQLGALMRRIGVNNQIVGLDRGADMDAIDRPWSDDTRAQMQAFVDDIYDRFVGIAAESRKMSPDALRAIAGGRVWSGAQAVELGLVDSLGGLDDALAMVRKEAGVPDDVFVRHAPQPKEFAEILMEQMFDARALAAAEPRLLGVLKRFGDVGMLWTLLQDSLNPSGPAKVYAMLPLGLRVD
ncbi:MAG: signal peptide peptidase SppA [Planctomycetota bacterium]